VATDYPQGQMSKLSKENFKATMGGVYADIKNDMTDPRFTNQLQALFNGRPMRGKSMKIVLQNDSNEKVSLFSVKIIYFYSEMS